MASLAGGPSIVVDSVAVTIGVLVVVVLLAAVGRAGAVTP